jgi:hypothetical protein
LKSFAKSISRGVPVLGILLAACGNWCNDCDEPKIFYRYVNGTDYELVIRPSEQLRADTLIISEGDSVEVKESWLQSSEYEENRYELRFRSQPESCLVFQGKIQNRALDIRVGNYQLDSAKSMGAEKVYRLVIGADHLRASSPCSTAALPD